MAKKIIAVAGATGNQGGSVIKALANDPNYEIRALTRDASKPSAKKLLDYGSNITLHECDFASESSLSSALQGAYGFYALTNYFSHRIDKVEDITEYDEGKLLADVAKRVGVKHFIWSTLNEVKERSGGKWSQVYHFDGKYKVEQYARGLGFDVTSFVAPTCYYQNFMGPGSSVKAEDGTVIFMLPLPSLDSTIPACDIDHDLGPVVKGILDLGAKANGKVFPIVSELISPNKVVADFEKVTGKKARFQLLPKEPFIQAVGQHVGTLGGLDLWEMFSAFADIGFGAYGEPEVLNNTNELGVHLNTWADFLKTSGWKGPE